MKRKNPCPSPRTLTEEEQVAGFFIDRDGWTCYRSPNPFVRFLDWSCSYRFVKYVTLWTFVSAGLFVAGFCLIGRAHPGVCTLLIGQGLLFLVLPLDQIYRHRRHDYLRKHGLPGPYGNGSLDRTPRGYAWLDQSKPDASSRLFDPTIPLLLLFDPLGLRDGDASAGAATRASAAVQAGPSSPPSYAYTDDTDRDAEDYEDDYEEDDDTRRRDGWTFDPFADDDDEMICHMEDPDDPFL